MIDRRRRTTPDRLLHVKVGLFFLAAGVWLTGVVAGLRWLTGVAILLLAAALVLRLLSNRGGAYSGPEDDEADGA
jgi:hypothetical protein